MEYAFEDIEVKENAIDLLEYTLSHKRKKGHFTRYPLNDPCNFKNSPLPVSGLPNCIFSLQSVCNEKKETLSKVADYNKLEKERVTKAGNIAFGLAFVICAPQKI